MVSLKRKCKDFRLTTVYVDMKKQKVSMTLVGTPVSVMHLSKADKQISVSIYITKDIIN